MKRLQHIFSTALLGTATLLAACSGDDLATEKPNINNNPGADSLHTLTLQLEASKPCFEQTPSQRGTNTGTSWNTGDKLYLVFSANGTTSTGAATYNATSQNWALQYAGNLPSTSNGRLTAYYFESPEEEGLTSVTLNGKSAVYADTLGSYSFDGVSVSAVATLQPANSRLRFQGEAGDTIYVNNWVVNDNYDIYTHNFEQVWTYNYPLIVSKTAASDGKYYTDYIYSTTSPDYNTFNQRITVINKKQAYTHPLTEANLKHAQSGYLTLPGIQGAANWIERSPFVNLAFPDSIPAARRKIITDYLGQMVQVEGGNLTLGSSSDQVNVYMYPFFMMKTEVSNGFYTAVMGKNPTYNNLSKDVTPDNYPLDGGTTNLPTDARGTEAGITSAELLKFISKLNQITGLYFDIPYETEWEYAARGGQRSHGYSYIAGVATDLYSGSSSWGDLTSYLQSNYYKHIVTEGPANELGIYGLCSNVSEACRFVGNYSALSTFNFTVDKMNDDDLEFIIYRGATGYEAYRSMAYATPYPHGHYAYSNYSRGLRLILRYQDNL